MSNEPDAPLARTENWLMPESLPCTFESTVFTGSFISRHRSMRTNRLLIAFMYPTCPRFSGQRATVKRA